MAQTRWTDFVKPGKTEAEVLADIFVVGDDELGRVGGRWKEGRWWGSICGDRVTEYVLPLDCNLAWHSSGVCAIV